MITAKAGVEAVTVMTAVAVAAAAVGVVVAIPSTPKYLTAVCA